MSNFLKTAITISAMFGFVFLVACSDSGDKNDKHYPPAKPQGLSAVASNANEIFLSWEKDMAEKDAADYYRIFYQLSSDFQWYPITTSANIYDNKIKIIGLTASTTYHFKLVAVNEYGTSDTSDIASEKTLIDTPKNLKTTFLPNNTLMLEWNKVLDNEEELEKLRGTGGGGNQNQSNVRYKVYMSQNEDDFTDENETAETRKMFFNLDNTKTYYFKVSAVDINEREGEKSNSVSANILGDLPPAPLGLSASFKIDALDNGKIGAQLSWNTLSDANEYRIYYSTQPQVAYEYYAPTRENSVTVNELKQGTIYYFKVSAVNSVGEGERSEVFLQTPAPTAPSTPTGLTAEGTAILDFQSLWIL
jgi:titin